MSTAWLIVLALAGTVVLATVVFFALAGLGYCWRAHLGAVEDLEPAMDPAAAADPSRDAPQFRPPPLLTPAPVRWYGWQDGFGVRKPFPIWTLTEDIPGHSKGSAVGEQSLRQAGYFPPPPPPFFPKTKS